MILDPFTFLLLDSVEFNHLPDLWDWYWPYQSLNLGTLKGVRPEASKPPQATSKQGYSQLIDG